MTPQMDGITADGKWYIYIYNDSSNGWNNSRR